MRARFISRRMYTFGTLASCPFLSVACFDCTSAEKGGSHPDTETHPGAGSGWSVGSGRRSRVRCGERQLVVPGAEAGDEEARGRYPGEGAPLPVRRFDA